MDKIIKSLTRNISKMYFIVEEEKFKSKFLYRKLTFII